MSDILKDFGAKVRKYRMKKGISQEAFAEQAGLHRTYITQLESGKRNIALKNVEKVAKALGVKIQELL